MYDILALMRRRIPESLTLWQNFVQQALNAFFGLSGLRVDGTGFEEPGEGGAGLFWIPIFELAGFVESEGEVGDFWSKEF
jgi:hypothetical protein